MRKTVFAAGVMLVILFCSITAAFAAENGIEFSGKKENGYFVSDVTVQFRLSAEKGIKTVTAEISGKKVAENIYETEGECPYAVEDEFVIGAEYLVKTEPDDFAYELKLNITDSEGTVSHIEKTFKANINAPEVSIKGAENGGIYASDRKITVSVKDENAKRAELAVTVKHNGETASHVKDTADKSFVYETSAEGEYEITAVAEDVTGRTDKKSVSFTADKSGPEITDMNITGHRKDGYDWFDDSFCTAADIKDNVSGIADISVFVNGNRVLEKKNLSGDYHLEEVTDRAFLEKHESADGTYVVEIKATDTAGNVSIARQSVNADVKKPEMLLSGVEKGAFLNRNPVIVAEAADNYADLNTVMLKINGPAGEKTVSAAGMAQYDAFGRDGKYEISTYCTDKAGNVSDTVSTYFIKDTVAPVISLSGAKKGAYYSSKRKITARVKDVNFSGVAAQLKTEKTIKGKKSAAGSISIRPDKIEYSKSFSYGTTGTYAVVLSARDAAGNSANPVGLTFTVDTEKPVIKISGVKKINGYKDKVAPVVEYQDSYPGKCNIVLKRMSGKDIKGLSYKDKKGAWSGKRAYSDFVKKRKYDDNYILTCVVTDKAGNTARKEVEFAVDRFGSKFEVTSGADLEKAYLKSMDGEIVICETNVTPLRTAKGVVTLDSEELDIQPEIRKSEKDGRYIYEYVYPSRIFEREGIYELDTKSKDSAGNESVYSERDGRFRIYIDRTKPVITAGGIESGKSFDAEDAKLTLSVSDGISPVSYSVRCGENIICSSDGNSVTGEEEILFPEGVRQNINIIASDAAGNRNIVSIEDVTVSSNAFVRILSNRKLIAGVAGALILIVIATAVMHRRKETEE